MATVNAYSLGGFNIIKDVFESIQVVEVEEEGGYDLEPCLKSAVWRRVALVVSILILVLILLLRQLHFMSCRLFQNARVCIGSTDGLLVLQLDYRHIAR